MATEYITLNRSNGVTKQGSPFAQFKLANETEMFQLAVWDCAPSMGPQPGQLVYFMSIQERDGKRSANARDMRVGQVAAPDHPLYQLMPHPTPRAEWDACLQNLLGYCTDQQLIPIIREWGAKLYTPYSEKPAGSAMHHAFPGGLVKHTYQMLHMLEGLYPCLPYAVKVERCILGILFHDYGKLKEYDEAGEKQADMFLLGHIYMSAFTLQHILDEAGVDREEQKCLVHCILAHHGEREYGSPVTPCLQEAVIINMLDNLSAKTDSLDGTGNGEYCAALGTHILKR